ENAFEIMKELISSNVGLIVVDSVATLIPKSELEGEMNQSLGSHARLMSKGLKIINNELSKRGIETVIIFINQLRQKISTFGGGFGNPETTTGGYALKFIASLRIKLKRVGRIEKDNNYIGIETLSEVIKNKISAPYKKTRIELMFNGGIQKERELLEKAVEKDIIKKNAGWYIFENETINGKENVISYLFKNPDVFEKIKKLVMKSN
ncbi:MAG TPA: DNA recombination/repair protein RecA, partial [Mycoplasmatales bacterium]|nr:DNA recombination/repair protein RecA [Mycoplasmatales bacterium]